MAEQTIKFDISGMHCVNCATTIERNLGKLNGIKSAQVNFSRSTGVVCYNPDVINSSGITKSIKAMGYTAKERARATGSIVNARDAMKRSLS